MKPDPAEVVPTLPEGTPLHLRSGEWYHLHTTPPGAYVDLVVVKVHADRVRDGRVWVSGHDLTCSYPSVDPHPPCQEYEVSIAALRRHAERLRLSRRSI